jgi:putative Holliday junction resolvase
VTAILGIDLGSRRIGVAIVEAGDVTARPLTTLARGDEPGSELRAIAELARAHAVTELVVGLPLEASGAAGPMAAAASAWADSASVALGLPVVMRDERLSSHLAESRLGPMPRGRSGGPPSRTQRERYRARVDREAAAVILQDELDARRAASPDAAGR